MTEWLKDVAEAFGVAGDDESTTTKWIWRFIYGGMAISFVAACVAAGLR